MLPFKNIDHISVQNQQDGIEVEIPEDLENVSYGQAGDHSKRSEMLMGLGLAKAGVVAVRGYR